MTCCAVARVSHSALSGEVLVKISSTAGNENPLSTCRTSPLYPDASYGEVSAIRCPVETMPILSHQAVTGSTNARRNAWPITAV